MKNYKIIVYFELVTPLVMNEILSINLLFKMLLFESDALRFCKA